MVTGDGSAVPPTRIVPGDAEQRTARSLPRVAVIRDRIPRRRPPSDPSRREERSMADRPVPPSPYDFLPEVPAFDVTSSDVSHGELLPTPLVSGMMGAGGEDRSPQLSWRGF